MYHAIVIISSLVCHDSIKCGHIDTYEREKFSLLVFAIISLSMT